MTYKMPLWLVGAWCSATIACVLIVLAAWSWSLHGSLLDFLSTSDRSERIQLESVGMTATWSAIFGVLFVILMATLIVVGRRTRQRESSI